MANKIISTFDFPTDPKFWQDWFSKDINRSSSWILSARDLLEHIRVAADALQAAWIDFYSDREARQAPPPAGQHRVFLFLSAVAIENLLKAVIVDKAKWADSQIAEEIPKELNSHMLLDLAAAGAVELTDDEIELLERLTEFGIWLGRYPAPTRLLHAKPKKLKSGIVNLAGFMHGMDIRDVESFVNKLIEKLKGVQGVEQLFRFPVRAHQDFEGTSISPQIRPW